MSKRALTTLTAAFLLWAVAPGSASAQQQTFDACYVPEVGTMYLINLSGLPTECLSTDHVQVTFPSPSVAGLQGNALSTTAPSDGHVLTWNGRNAEWEPQTPPRGGVTDHGNLSGLADDDHAQYLLADGTRALAGNLSVGTNRLTDLAAATDPGDAVRFEQAVKNGDAAAGDLGGTFPDPSVGGLQGNALSTTAPSDGQVLTWNGTNTEWEPQTSPSGVTDHGNLSGLADDDHAQYLLADGVRDVADGFAVTGTEGTGVIPVEGAGTRVMWYPGKAAFRAGEVTGAQWDDANVGSGSVAFGRITTASGIAATAMGGNTTASGRRATAMGNSTTASHNFATAMGDGTTASSIAATAMGSTTTASGIAATAMGAGTTAQAEVSLVIGRWNVVEGNQTAWVPTDPLFVAGNGRRSTSRSNALTLLKNGNMTIAGTLTESSDARLKTGIEPLGTVLESLRSIEPVRFQFRDGTGHPTDAQIGLLAQEVEEVFPELVTRDSEGYLSLAYPKLTAVLVKALQEQQDEIERMADRLDRLEATIEQLQEREP